MEIHLSTTASEGWYSIYLPRRDGRPSWLRWLVAYRDGLSAHRRPPIQVLTCYYSKPTHTQNRCVIHWLNMWCSHTDLPLLLCA